MRKTIPLLFTASLTLAACSGMNATEQRTLSGGAMGAAGGAALGAIGGNAALGAVAGAGAGLIGGYVYDQHKKSQQQAFQQGYSAGRSGQ
jgi:osmotically inducible lipoprotein OsmB